MAEPNVQFKSTDVWSDSTLQRHFSYGDYTLPLSVAKRFEKEGRGSITSKVKKSDEAEEVEEITGEDSTAVNIETGSEGTQEPSGTEEKTDLPEEFPNRDELIKKGFDSLEKIKEAGNEGLLKAKLSQAKVTKIGLALAELDK